MASVHRVLDSTFWQGQGTCSALQSLSGQQAGGHGPSALASLPLSHPLYFLYYFPMVNIGRHQMEAYRTQAAVLSLNYYTHRK